MTMLRDVTMLRCLTSDWPIYQSMQQMQQVQRMRGGLGESEVQYLPRRSPTLYRSAIF